LIEDKGQRKKKKKKRQVALKKGKGEEAGVERN